MSRLTRRQLALLFAVGLAALALAVGTYGLATGPRPGMAATGSNEPRSPSVPAPQSVTGRVPDPASRALPRTDDAVAYARAVATALFTWDTTSGYLPTDYQAAVLADADPTGEETSGLIADVVTYLPTTEQWLDLATMAVSQTLSIDAAAIPAGWESIAAGAHGQLRPGTVAVTITGTRTRTGVWDGEPALKTSPVAFTVFLACRPAFDQCHLLRLSQLDNPLQ